MSHTSSTTFLSERSGRAPKRTGFTLLEILVTIGAVAIVSVGIAAIFSSVGEAVATGRRVSRMNQYGRLVENQLRQDFAGMTRDGFLVMRQQFADGNGDSAFQPDNAMTGAAGVDAVPLTEDDTTPRARRIDEIIFFSRGQFESARAALGDPTWRPTADTARIYYGHGQRRVNIEPGFPGHDPIYFSPKLNDAPAIADHSLGRVDGANRFASRWTLLRHACLLKPVAVSQTFPANGAVFGLIANPPTPNAGHITFLRDKHGQSFGQPAASSIFRAVCREMGPGRFGAGTTPPVNDYLWYVPGATGNVVGPPGDYYSPMFASGLVDIANTDLTEIRALMTGTALPDNYDPTNPPSPRTYLPSSATSVGTRPGPGAALDAMHAWMDNAFPGPAVDPNDLGTPYWGQSGSIEPAEGSRIRSEDHAVGLSQILGNPTGIADDDAFLRSDRLMLQAFNLAPACTEFVVEWSYGQTDITTGELFWHGPTRQVPNAASPAASPYPPASGGVSLPVMQQNGTIVQHDVTDRLIYGATPPAAQTLCLTSYFGFNDPTFTPDISGNGSLGDPTDAVDVQLPWAWPKLIRVRVTLVDPVDPRPQTEQTFEFVFETPAPGAS
jgi:type II secretory pathway pseudopilin PulG